MKYILSLSVMVIVLSSCANNDPKLSNGSLPLIDSSQLLLDLFKEINTSELHIYSPCDTVGGKQFEGTPIHPSFYKFLNFEGSLDHLFNDTSDHIYSCAKFRLSNATTGLIIRRPSQYDASAIDLYVWNNFEKRIVGVTNLADSFGDEGWFFVQDAWIRDLNHDNSMDIVTRRKDYDQDMDDSTKITRMDSLFVYSSIGTKFKKISFPVDTNQFQLFSWPVR